MYGIVKAKIAAMQLTTANSVSRVKFELLIDRSIGLRHGTEPKEMILRSASSTSNVIHLEREPIGYISGFRDRCPITFGSFQTHHFLERFLG